METLLELIGGIITPRGVFLEIFGLVDGLVDYLEKNSTKWKLLFI